ncbi:glycosyltransferase family 1 protein [Sphingobacterium olei]|uniref:Glycosyltransferase family 1 protein n=1 Tax=Sphingobacterium olei TaxID=2571155 RepID=A0A4U0NEB7_9SPHI|nr:glycosyltransferase family 1 protein [Sphingobacterium olei]TJZ52417.1 glycosyltransferase family 1 protein [Sphingobacterium olei]
MKRVAFFAEILIEDFDGASRTMFQLINRLDSSSMEYFFIYGKGPETFRHYLSYRVPSINIPINTDYSLAIPFVVKRDLEQALDNFAPDAIHISTPSPLGYYALKYAKRKNIPVLSIYHTHFISYIPYYLRRAPLFIKVAERWIQHTMRKFYNACDQLYVPSMPMISELERLGIAREQMTLWQRGIDLELFSISKRDINYIQQITKNKKPNILFASRLVWEKNIQTLIDIYTYMESQNMDYNFIVVGDGNAKKEAMAQMPNAFFLGKLNHEELSKVYASSDVFLFTSVSETYGNVVVEAMASGLPCVIANGGGSGGLVKHGQNGFKCTPNSPKEYAYFIQRLIDQPAIYGDLQLAGLSYVKKLDWENLAQRYFSDMQSLTNLPTAQLAWATN